MTAAASSPAPDDGRHAAVAASVALLGARIRQLRKERGLTLVQLAAATGLSHSFISQVERGLASLSMSSLFRVAQALGTSQHELLTAGVARPSDDTAPQAVLRSGAGAPALASGGPVRALAHGSDHPFIPIEFSASSPELTEPWRHREDEFIYVVAGRARLEIDGVVQDLDPGDSAYLTGGTEHRWASADGGPYRLLVIKERAHPPDSPAPSVLT